MVLYSIRQPHHAILEHGHSKGAARRLCEHACDAATKEGTNAFISENVHDGVHDAHAVRPHLNPCLDEVDGRRNDGCDGTRHKTP